MLKIGSIFVRLKIGSILYKRDNYKSSRFLFFGSIACVIILKQKAHHTVRYHFNLDVFLTNVLDLNKLLKVPTFKS